MESLLVLQEILLVVGSTFSTLMSSMLNEDASMYPLVVDPASAFEMTTFLGPYVAFLLTEMIAVMLVEESFVSLKTFTSAPRLNPGEEKLLPVIVISFSTSPLSKLPKDRLVISGFLLIVKAEVAVTDPASAL